MVHICAGDGAQGRSRAEDRSGLCPGSTGRPLGAGAKCGKADFLLDLSFQTSSSALSHILPPPILSSCEQINLRAPVQMLLAAVYPGGRDAGCVYSSAAMETALNKAAQTVGAAASFPGVGVPVLMTRVHDGHIIRAVLVQGSGRPQTATILNSVAPLVGSLRNL